MWWHFCKYWWAYLEKKYLVAFWRIRSPKVALLVIIYYFYWFYIIFALKLLIYPYNYCFISHKFSNFFSSWSRCFSFPSYHLPLALHHFSYSNSYCNHVLGFILINKEKNCHLLCNFLLPPQVLKLNIQYSN